jgi:ATP-dependent RNA helicase DeaD
MALIYVIWLGCQTYRCTKSAIKETMENHMDAMSIEETAIIDAGRKPTDVAEEILLDEEETVVQENIFEQWGLSKEVLKSLIELKFSNPTPIQKQAIPLLLARKKDFVGLAATGTGKTGAFGIPLVETIDASKKSVQALVMCPTRELATQVEAQIQKMAKWKGLTTLTVYGGSSYDRQITALKRGVHIVVGTPGRLCDLVDRKVLKLNDVQTLILDEADEMISMGFQDDLEKILGAIGDDENKRKWLFSATMSPEIRRVVSRYLPDYDKVEIHKEDSQKPNIEQIYYTIYPDRKLQMLSSVLYMNPEFYGLVFCQTKREVTEITEWLKRKSFKVDCIHGDRPQRERDFILKDFRTGRVKILVATDVAARGLDINDLTHVINFSLPREVESYVHRIGRTGRAGKKGLALSIVAPHEVRTLKRIQQVTKATLTKGLAPTNDELNVYRVKDVISSMNQVESDDVYFRAGKFLDRKMSELKELFQFDFTPEEFLKRLLVSEHPDIFENRDTSMDFVGDGVIPREMQDYGSRERGPVGRDSSGPRDRFDRGGVRSFGFGGGGGRRNDRGGDRPPRRFDGDRPRRTDGAAKPGFKTWNADDSSERPRVRSERTEFKKPSADRRPSRG